MENPVDVLLYFALQMPISKSGIINVTKQFPYYLGMRWGRLVMVLMPRYAFETETDSLDSMLTAGEDEIDEYICQKIHITTWLKKLQIIHHYSTGNRKIQQSGLRLIL